MAKEWDRGCCNEKSGFLFSHVCFRPQKFICESCQKPVCEDHSHQLDGSCYCTTCVKKRQSKSSKNRSGHGHDHRRDNVYNDYHDPYFYGGYYYGYGYYGHGYYGHSHHDPNDFTEADAESLVGEADGDFENDMSES